MARRDGEELPTNVKPCADFVVSEKFQDRAVDQMRGEVMKQVSGSGLDRMAMLKAKGKPADGAQSHQSKNQ